MNKSSLRCSALLLALLMEGISPTGARAETANGSAAERMNWPETVTVTVGDIRTRIEKAKMWTMSGIDYQDTVMAVQESAYGTVITIRDVGHLGTAHFLDVPGRPGEIETEEVIGFNLFVNDEPVRDFLPQMSLSGESFRMERSSKIRALDLKSTLLLQKGTLVETQTWHATEAIDLRMSYPLMYAWTPEATHYVFGGETGIQKRGLFLREGKANDGGMEKEALWMGVFNPSTGKGSVCYLLQHPADADAWFQWTDGPGIYRKLRIMTFVEQIVPKGFKGTYQAAVGFFNATEADWEERAQQKASELKALGQR